MTAVDLVLDDDDDPDPPRPGRHGPGVRGRRGAPAGGVQEEDQVPARAEPAGPRRDPPPGRAVADQPAAPVARGDAADDRGVADRHRRAGRSTTTTTTTGTRILTYQRVLRARRPARRAGAARGTWRRSREYCPRRNRMGNREMDFFMADGPVGWSAGVRAAYDVRGLGRRPRSARGVRRRSRRRFRDAVRPEFRRDDLDSPQWRSRMYAALIGQTDKAVSEEALLGLSAEFFMQVEWLPGGRIEDGELILDPVFEEEDARRRAWPADDHRLCDEKARGFIFNFIRDYGDLEYVNIGRVGGVAVAPRRVRRAAGRSTWRRSSSGARRSRSSASSACRSGASASTWTRARTCWRRSSNPRSTPNTSSTAGSGCRQLGMNLSPRADARKVGERYAGPQRPIPRHVRSGRRTSSATTSPAWRPTRSPPAGSPTPRFALAFARLLGRAAAPNLILGPVRPAAATSIFDDGDELVVEDARRPPGRHGRRRPHRHVRRLPARPAATWPPPTPAPVTQAAAPVPDPRRVRRGVPGRLRRAVHADPAASTASASGRSTPCSSTCAATRAAASPTAGSGCWHRLDASDPLDLAAHIRRKT